MRYLKKNTNISQHALSVCVGKKIQYLSGKSIQALSQTSRGFREFIIAASQG